VTLAASGGGHFDLLFALAGVVPRAHREWVTVPGPRSRALTKTGERVNTVPTFDSSHLNWKNPLRSIVLALRLRPDIVLTSGAGVVLTFTLVARLLGAQVVFVETMARVSGPSRTGSILARIATLHIVQWPELVRLFPEARLCRPVLLPRRVTLQRSGAGTFVSVGTHSEPFDRLLEMVDIGLDRGLLPGPCRVQAGTSSFTSPRMDTHSVLPPSEFAAGLAGSRYIIGHCGAGLIASALSAGRRPIIVARRSELHEHVDNHQTQLAKKLAELDLVVCVETSIDADAVRAADQPLAGVDAFADLPEADALLNAYLSPLWRD
jgi:UDP-N-acetylglucosamine--N-acetylmuramyl-(pentapeptide) pyrophosphoryl-undecaprenol N-acetylglucosamine transferase